jgi:hypothetical protein
MKANRVTHFCCDCQHSDHGSVPVCEKTRRIKTYWSDGSKETIYLLCDAVNTNGHCKDFTQVPTFDEWWADVKAGWKLWWKK